MRVSNQTLLTAFTLFLVGTLALWFFNTFEPVVEEVEVGLRGEARINDYLAAQRLIERLDGEAHSLPALDRLFPLPDPGGATLFIPTPRLGIDLKRFRELRDWVVAGGHLIVVIWETEEGPVRDPLLEELGVTQRILDHDELGDGPTLVETEPGTRPLEVDFDPQFVLVDGLRRAHRRAGDGGGNHLLGFRLGSGELTVLSDAEFWKNDAIGDYDHAALFWNLTRLEGRGGAVSILYGDDMPPLWEWLIGRAGEAGLVAILLLATWLWYASPRFGPLLPRPEAPRRSLGEHLRASGQFLWRRKGEEALAHATRAALLERMAHARPRWQQLPKEQLYKRLALHARVDPDAVRDALEGGATRHSARFTRRIRTLETIRKSL